MIYQKLYLGNPPYVLATRYMDSFPLHKHPEVELIYCINGAYNIEIGEKTYRMEHGELAIIGSMVSHEVIESEEGANSMALVVETGPAMLGYYFNLVANYDFPDVIIDLKQEKYASLYELIQETVELKTNPSQFSNLILNGNTYKICAEVFKTFVNEPANNESTTKSNSIMAITNALEHIYNNYSKKITVDEVANMCGYSKSNFCKIFKNITGDTFHNTLNKHRVKNSRVLLENSDISLDEVATQVGFADGKSFHKVFKAVMGVTPGTYKKEHTK